VEQIGKITGYYGGLHVDQEGSKFYWAIENHTITKWEEIPGYLYDALIKYENEREK